MSDVPEPSSLPAATLDELMPLVFNELRRLARRQLGRAHFYAAAPRTMRTILIDAARRCHWQPEVETTTSSGELPSPRAWVTIP